MSERMDYDEDAALLALLDAEPMPDEFDEPEPDWRHDRLVDELTSVMRWRRAARLRRDRTARPFDRELARISAARDEAVGPRDREVARIEERALMLLAALYQLDGTKSVATPHGRVTSMQTGGNRVVVDEVAAIEWAEQNAPGAVKRSLLVSQLPKDVPIPGTSFASESRAYTIAKDRPDE